MDVRSSDGSAGDVDYGSIGTGYPDHRRPDPRIARVIADALGGARNVVNVGAGAGSYESAAVAVTAVEPSESMRAQRSTGLPRAVDAVAENLPFADGEFDGAMTLFSVHQWSDVDVGLREMRRVTRGPVAVLTCDPELVRNFWLYEYAPEVLDTEARRYPALGTMAEALGGTVGVQSVPIPLDCTDGFNEAYYGRPEMLLDPAARQACSAWSFVDDGVRERFTDRLRADLDSGAWDARFGHLRSQSHYEGSLVIVRATPQEAQGTGEQHHGGT
ncbi:MULTISPECIES: class I SAM-dependent methyltransferase [unclassified Streptomyces]|uniref:class I SAM-dependent methyltransferase n=1 Tax=unclassified Streptomyces TaxID=2593676 RepID=UPI002E14321F|nr:class I SAM-dependent methyltransferase [Streptomyces sp. NBC_01197]WSS52459.1 class I SAM-dependent methyltransferase [Streptomyces sp. NBC_01180]